ncbi:hypothetical protein LWP59_30225 [Amycolatopsis acidiphila]|uniref:EamA family transporter n=1 Tax=Amycolatopsis acidiphila TaxID=715473 RepID=UPI001643A49E|nr:EamA family transporter [Amycolatopsis acidiphila]UIJ58363.1 hypothetical protein LWP59_30225 [Amycolatopsis acidiphila]
MHRVRSVLAGVTAMAFVGGSVGISRTLVTAPLFTTQAIRYAAAFVLLLALWLTGVAGCGLVLFNVAVVRGVGNAEPAVMAVAVACVPVLLGVVGPLLQRQRPRRRLLVAAVVVTIGGALGVAGRGDLRGGLLTGVAPVAAALAGGKLPGPLVWTGILVVVAGLAVGLLVTRSAERGNSAAMAADSECVTPGRSAPPAHLPGVTTVQPVPKGHPWSTSPPSAATATAAARSSTSTPTPPRRSGS